MGVFRLYSYAHTKGVHTGRQIALDGSSCLLVDGNGLLFEIACKVPHQDGNCSTGPLYYTAKCSYQAYFYAAMSYLAPFVKAKMKLIFVFDNNIGAAETRFKDDESDQRRLNMLEELVDVQQSLLGNRPLGEKFKDKQPPRLAMYASQLRAAIKQCDFQIRQSFNEADAQMANMFLEEPSITAIMAKDSDFYVFLGCRCISFEDIQIDSSGRIKGLMFSAEEIARSLGDLTHSQLVDTALILGCDYTKAVNARVNLADCLQVDGRDPEAVASWVKTFARDGVRSYAPFKALLDRNDDFRAAWVYSYSLYMLERRSRTPTELVAALPDLPNRDLVHLLAAGVEKGQVPSSYLKYVLQRRWTGGLDFEMVYADDEGRPPIARMLQPLRGRLYGLLGINEVTEVLRKGTTFASETVEGVQVCSDAKMLLYYLHARNENAPLFSLVTLESFIQQAFKVEGPAMHTDLSELAAKRPGLYLAALALRVVAYSNWASMCKSRGTEVDDDYRLTLEEFEALAATIVACQEGVGNAPPESISGRLTGRMVMDAASVASWFTHAFGFVKNLLGLFRGPAACLQVEPRKIYNPFTYQALRMGEMPRPDETTTMLCRIALKPLQAMGVHNNMLFRQDSTISEKLDQLASALGQMNMDSGERVHTPEQHDEEDDDDIRQYTMGDFDEDSEDDRNVDERPPARMVPLADLPIRGYRDEIVRTIRENPVTMIEGETGCGKSTQVPQYLIADDPYARVIVTQPTRLATKSAAKHVAYEMGCELGKKVGYRIRGEGEVSRVTCITYTTAGWLLALLVATKNQKPRFTHIIIDEVHGRSTDSDLLCLMTRLLLLQCHSGGTFRVVLMSATLQDNIFEEYFSRELRQIVPRLQVGIKRHPVTEIYLEDFRTTWPVLFDEGRLKNRMAVDNLLRMFSKVRGGESLSQVRPGISHQTFELAAHLIRNICKPGETVLVFVSGISDVDTLYELLEADRRKSPKLDILICHSLISLEEQSRSLEPNVETARVVLATSMAESSITFPLVTYVIDLGVCKRITYDQREHRTVLQPWWISKASMKQRSGRTGRVCPGMAIRFYTRDVARAADPYSPPEILTRPLEQVVIRLKVMKFPTVYGTLEQCIDPPELEQVDNAINGLYMMRALTGPTELSPVTFMGYMMGSLGLDVKVTRMILLGIALSCPIEAIVLGAAISVQDPFVMAHPAATDDVKDYLKLVKRVQAARDKYSHGLGSDPLTILFLYIDWVRLAPEARSSFLYRHGLAVARMNNLDGCVNTIATHISSHGKSVPNYAELLSNLQKPTFELKVLEPNRLFILRALLAGAFYSNMLHGKAKPKANHTELASRTLKIGDLPIILSTQDQLERALCMGPLEEVSINDSMAEVVFPRQDQLEGDDVSSAVMFADEDPLGRYTDICSSIKALFHARDFKGGLFVAKPQVEEGMPGYIPPGAPEHHLQEVENLSGDGRCAMNKLTKAGRIKAIKSMRTGVDVHINKQSVLNNAAIPTKAKAAALYFTTSDVQKIMNKDGEYRRVASNVTLLPFSESVITMIAAAFATDEPVAFMKYLDFCSDDGSDDLDLDVDIDTYRCMSVGTWLNGTVALPAEIPEMINRFRFLVSRCIGKKHKGILTSSSKAARLLLRLRNLVDKAVEHPSPSDEGLACIEEVYEVRRTSTSSAALPKRRRRMSGVGVAAGNDDGDDDDDDDDAEDEEEAEEEEGEEEHEEVHHQSQAWGNSKSPHLEFSSRTSTPSMEPSEDIKPDEKKPPTLMTEEKELAPVTPKLDVNGVSRERQQASLLSKQTYTVANKKKWKEQLRLQQPSLTQNQVNKRWTKLKKQLRPFRQQEALITKMADKVRKSQGGYPLKRLRLLPLSDKKGGPVYEGPNLEEALLQRGLHIRGGMVYARPPTIKPMDTGGGSATVVAAAGGGWGGPSAESTNIMPSQEQNDLNIQSATTIPTLGSSGQQDTAPIPSNFYPQNFGLIDMMVKQVREAGAMGCQLGYLGNLRLGKKKENLTYQGDDLKEALLKEGLYIKDGVVYAPFYVPLDTHPLLINKMVETINKSGSSGCQLNHIRSLSLKKKDGGARYTGTDRDLQQLFLERGLHCDGKWVYPHPPSPKPMKMGGGSATVVAAAGGWSPPHNAQLINMMVTAVRKAAAAGYSLEALRNFPLSQEEGAPTYQGDDLEERLIERGLCIAGGKVYFHSSYLLLGPPGPLQMSGSAVAAAGGGWSGQQQRATYYPQNAKLINMMVLEVRETFRLGCKLGRLRLMRSGKKQGGLTYQGNDLEDALREKGLCVEGGRVYMPVYAPSFTSTTTAVWGSGGGSIDAPVVTHSRSRSLTQSLHINLILQKIRKAGAEGCYLEELRNLLPTTEMTNLERMLLEEGMYIDGCMVYREGRSVYRGY